MLSPSGQSLETVSIATLILQGYFGLETSRAFAGQLIMLLSGAIRSRVIVNTWIHVGFIISKTSPED